MLALLKARLFSVPEADLLRSHLLEGRGGGRTCGGIDQRVSPGEREWLRRGLQSLEGCAERRIYMNPPELTVPPDPDGKVMNGSASVAK